MEAYVWDRDSHGLYDYESKQVNRVSLRSTGCNMLVRSDMIVKALAPSIEISEKDQSLAAVVFKQQQYWLYHCKSLKDDSFKNHAEHVWRIVKFATHQGKQNQFRIKQGDLMKFGRVRFFIKKLVIDTDDIVESAADEINDMQSFTNKPHRTQLDGTQNRIPTTLECDNYSQLQINQHNLNTDPETRMTMNFNRETPGFDNRPFELEQIQSIKQHEQEIKLKSKILRRQSTNKSNVQEKICRICLSEEEVKSKLSNPLINPCSCTGSMKFIHLMCLKEWLEGKKHMKETNVVNSYIWKNLECEICKTQYQESTILNDGRVVSLLQYDIHEDAKSYMIIESVTNTTSKTIHVINFSEKRKIKVGRGQNAEVRITDISVSRIHSIMRMNKAGEIYLEDNESKFGTLALLREITPLKVNLPLFLQIGRVVMGVYAVNRFSCFQRCLGLSNNKRDKYLSFEDVQKFVPSEFSELFDDIKPKNAKSANQSRIIDQETNQNTSFALNNQYNNAPYQSIHAISNHTNFQDNPYSTSTIQNQNQVHIRSQFDRYRNDERQVSVAIEFNTQPDAQLSSALQRNLATSNQISDIQNQRMTNVNRMNSSEMSQLREDNSSGINIPLSFSQISNNRQRGLERLEELKEEDHANSPYIDPRIQEKSRSVINSVRQSYQQLDRNNVRASLKNQLNIKQVDMEDRQQSHNASQINSARLLRDDTVSNINTLREAQHHFNNDSRINIAQSILDSDQDMNLIQENMSRLDQQISKVRVNHNNKVAPYQEVQINEVMQNHSIFNTSRIVGQEMVYEQDNEDQASAQFNEQYVEQFQLEERQRQSILQIDNSDEEEKNDVRIFSQMMSPQNVEVVRMGNQLTTTLQENDHETQLLTYNGMNTSIGGTQTIIGNQTLQQDGNPAQFGKSQRFQSNQLLRDSSKPQQKFENNVQ